MRRFYLIAAILGAVVPYLFFIAFFSSEGFDLATFVTALFANGAVSGFTADLLISSAVFWAWMFNRAGPRPWPFILLNLTIGLSCALPAYFYVAAKNREQSQPG